jgi:hypothetical protein
MSHSPDIMHIYVADRRQRDPLLEKAEVALRPVAMSRQAGVLVTRIDSRRYTVAVSSDVPIGLTRELSLY